MKGGIQQDTPISTRTKQQSDVARFAEQAGSLSPLQNISVWPTNSALKKRTVAVSHFDPLSHTYE
jgi:hypothetical protein